MEFFKQTFNDLSAAIGWTAIDGCRVTSKGKTRNQGIAEQGFSKTIYATTPDGTRWTIHHNPTNGTFAGAHRSSSKR